MSNAVTCRYEGERKVTLALGETGAVIATDYPTSGTSPSFGPTDLFAGSLGACMLTVMAIYAERSQLNLKGMWVEVEKDIRAGRISPVRADVHLPSAIVQNEGSKLESVCLACPVHRSLDHELDVNVSFTYDV